ncbi:protein ANTHESIS POMOTING FACTOR 1 [Carica papaya]|uniref:protein ANTHESIS POMOTING FACTOR 1 n=1 Tax=Carica papaya TaxID=3649 RepID=UPI000B8D044D|nr:protein ANTHESIS POMOTING FACTOR 1 [Carica papaya]
MVGTQSEKEEKVSLELTEEILQSMEVGMVFRDYNCRISSMDFHRTSSYLVTASDDDSIRLYDVSSATCLKTINSKKYGVELVCFTSHPTTVIYSSKNGWDESLRLLSLHDNKYLRYFRGHHDRVVSLSLCSRKECFISGSLDRTVLLWDQRAEKCQGLLHVQGRPATAYDDQGLVFAIAFGGCIRMFDARMYEKGPFEIFSVGNDFSGANVVKFSSDGRLMLLTTTNGRIHVLDSFRGTLLSTYNVKPVSSNSTLDASFSPEGMFVISGTGDGSVYAWNVRSGKEVATWMGPKTEPPVIRWAPGSLMFVTGSSELSFFVPDLSKLAAYAGRK